MLTKLNKLFRKATDGKCKLPKKYHKEFQDKCLEVLTKQFMPKEPREFKYRMSQIGRDIRMLQCQKLGLETDAPLPDNFSLKMTYGDLVEALIIVLLKASGVNVQVEQLECELELEHQLITGTLDIIIDDKVWDIKTCSDYAYKFKFVDFKTLYAKDDFGYVPQLYLYSEATGYDVGGWIVINKSSGQIKIIKASKSKKVYEEVLDSVAQNIISLQHTYDISDIDDTLPLEEESFRQKKTGKLVLHKDYKYFDYKKVLWGDKLEYKPNELSIAKSPPYNWYLKEE